MWEYGNITLKGKIPVCIKGIRCIYFSVELGYTKKNQKDECPIIFCGVGMFPMTEKPTAIPELCVSKTCEGGLN